MRKIIFRVFLLAVPAISNAQDTLYKENNVKVIGKVLEINKEQVKYKIAEVGPTYVIDKNEVSKIAYMNGHVDSFPVKNPISLYVKAPKVDPLSKDLGRNLIAINFFDILFRSITFSYERIFKSGNTSIKVPLSIGLNSLGSDPQSIMESRTGYYNSDKIFSTGLDFYSYPSGQGKDRFYYGPSVEYGMYHDEVMNYTTNYSNYSYTVNKFRNSFYSILFQMGILSQPTKNINFSLNFGIGYSKIFVKAKYGPSEYGELALRAGVLLGYKF